MKATHRLSDRSIVVLMAVRDRSGDDGSYWLPGTTSDWVDELSSHVNISGAGDASVLRSLRDRHLIERPRSCTMPTGYAYRITDAGRVAVELARGAGRIGAIAASYQKRHRAEIGAESCD